MSERDNGCGPMSILLTRRAPPFWLRQDRGSASVQRMRNTPCAVTRDVESTNSRRYGLSLGQKLTLTAISRGERGGGGLLDKMGDIKHRASIA